MSNKKPTTKVKFTESIINSSTKYKHIESGELLTFIDFKSESFQQQHIGIFNRVSDRTIIEYLMSEVELIN